MHFNAMCLIVKLCISCEPADPDVDEIRPCKFWVKGKANTSSTNPQMPMTKKSNQAIAELMFHGQDFQFS